MVFLGYIISAERIFVDLRKVEVVLKQERPMNVTKICSFLGLAGYYKSFIEGFLTYSSSNDTINLKRDKMGMVKKM